MRKLRVILAASIGLVLVPLVGAAPGKAEIVVYLPWESAQQARLKISYDGAPAAEIQPGRFFVINADPGRHLLRAGKGKPTAVDARAREESFVRVGRDIEIGPAGESDIPVLEVLSPEQARLEIINLVYVKAKKIFSSVVSREDPFVRRRPELKTRNSSQPSD